MDFFLNLFLATFGLYTPYAVNILSKRKASAQHTLSIINQIIKLVRAVENILAIFFKK